jgi:epoxyqueuosine reductase QueG
MARANQCPAGVIIAKDHDKAKCFEYYFSIINPLKQPKYGVKVTGCGLCQTKIPCEFEIPKLIRKK